MKSCQVLSMGSRQGNWAINSETLAFKTTKHLLTFLASKEAIPNQFIIPARPAHSSRSWGGIQLILRAWKLSRAWNFVSRSPCLWKERKKFRLSLDITIVLRDSCLRHCWTPKCFLPEGYSWQMPDKLKSRAQEQRAWPVHDTGGQTPLLLPSCCDIQLLPAFSWELFLTPAGHRQGWNCHRQLNQTVQRVRKPFHRKGSQPAASWAHGHWYQRGNWSSSRELSRQSLGRAAQQQRVMDILTGIVLLWSKSTTENTGPLFLRTGWLSIRGSILISHHLPKIQQYIIQLTSDIHTKVTTDLQLWARTWAGRRMTGTDKAEMWIGWQCLDLWIKT